MFRRCRGSGVTLFVLVMKYGYGKLPAAIGFWV